MKTKLLLSFLIFSTYVSFAQNNNQENLSNIFPNDGIAQLQTSGFSFNDAYSPSGSTWSITWNESHVYQCLMKYTDPNNSNLSYELRVGKGGQIYSFKTVSGETIPPQWRDPNGTYGSEYAPWVDEVWQLVAVDKSQNDTANDKSYYIHQAGVYLKDAANLSTPFYSPQVAAYYDATNQEYTTVNWGQHAHIGENLTAGFTSSLLYYTKFKNIGNGIVQVDYMMYNFGTDLIDHINMPWGGVRHSTYGNFFLSNSDNTFAEKTGSFGSSTNAFPTASTNGWVAFSNNASGSLPSLGLLADHSFGTTRLGDAGNIPSRNYTVYSGIRTNIDLSFGKQLRIRNYFVLDNSVPDIQSKIASLDLANKTYYGFESIAKSAVPSTKYYFESTSTSLSAVDTSEPNGLELQLQPYDNSYPLFIIEGQNNEFRITSDLYTYSTLPYDGKTVGIKLIGFSDTKKTVSLVNTTVCSGGNYTFPDGSTLTNITSNATHISDMGVNATNGYTELIQTNLTVDVNNTIQMVPRSKIGSNAATSDTVLELDNASSVTLQPQVTENSITSTGTTGTWSWTGPNGYTASGRVITISAFDATKAGDYVVTYSNSSDCQTSSMFNLTLKTNLNTDEFNKTQQYILSPNPTNNKTTIELKDVEIKSFAVFNTAGQEVTSKVTTEQTESNKIILYLKDLPTGNYYVKVNDMSGIKVVKK
jgi:hypothetical protein